MKKLAILSVVALAGLSGAASADELYNNGPVVNSNGRSVIFPRILGINTYGFGDQSSASNSVADNFTVTGSGWNVTDLDFFNYQTGAVGFTFTDVTWSIVMGDVNSGTVVASGTTAVTDGGVVGYRVTPGTLLDTSRAIYDLKADISDVSLTAGDYWLRWSVSGTGSSGPWQPSTSDRRVGDAQQSVAGGAYTPLIDTGTAHQQMDVPFIINGTVAAVPEPSTLLSLAAGLGLLGVMRRRRNT